MELLDCITELSHEFGTLDYVRAGGGNTSVKTDTTLWVKPSGIPLAALQPSDFVSIDRSRLATLYTLTPPSEASAREKLVKEVMERAVLSETSRRASVEAPLHDSLAARYVVHTHPARVNGMTCGKEGRSACQSLFPQALWLDYIDPGYTLCMEVRRQIQRYTASNGCEPSLIFLKNHGVFVAGDQPEAIHRLYQDVMTTLDRFYSQRKVSCEVAIGPRPEAGAVEAVRQRLSDVFGVPDVYVAATGAFALPAGPITPDHIVYAKSYYLMEEPTAAAMERFSCRHKYLPQIVAFDNMVFGVGPTQKKADLALELTLDGALVKQLAEAFGGLDYMTDRARQFIENWEVESYRSKQVG